MEAKHIAKKLDLSERVECLANNPAFITLKDHKENFQAKLPCRLINPSKSELGKISKVKLDKINKALVEKLNLNQWKNTASVIEWFKLIESKKDCTFIKFDIREFYLSITEDILNKTILFAKEHLHISDEDIRLINHCRKSLLFSENVTWKKKDNENSFDVTMGSNDGAELCENVGIYILSCLSEILNKKDYGLCRDDGLLILHNLNGQQIDCTRKNIIKIFKNIGFNIDIETNLKIVDFLDITFNLENNTYKPFKKPNDTLLYINVNSNHPPQIIKQLPKTINNRLSKNSSNKEVFNEIKIDYENALTRRSYANIKLNFEPPAIPNNKKKRQRNIIWFNPPFSRAVSTNVAKRFLQLIDKHFPPSNKLHKVFNRNTIKVSYCCTQNVRNIITSHNKQLIRSNEQTILPCNCKKKEECPLDGKCRAGNIIYKCVASANGLPDKCYLGTAEGDFKKRFYNHKKSFKNKSYMNETTLSKYVWDLKLKHKVTPKLKWSILKTVPSYSNITKRCKLCLQEKFEILTYPKQDELLNKRSELISKCRHMNKFLLSNYKAND